MRVTLWNFVVALANAVFAAVSLTYRAPLFATEAFLIAFFKATTFFAALSCDFKAAFLSGFLALASLALIAAILLTRALAFLVSTLAVCFLATALTLANAALALAILALITFFYAGGALINFFLS